MCDGVELEYCDECGEEISECWCDQQKTECDSCGEMSFEPHGECLNCGYQGGDGEDE